MGILLTGAAGFVGRKLLTSLKQRDLFTRALARSKETSLEIADETVIENLTHQSDFKALLAGIDTIIHLADGFNAYEHLPASDKNAQALDRAQTTAALASEAARTGADFVYLSTIKTMCGTHADNILTETSTPMPQSLYGWLKLQAENEIMAASQKHGTKAVILRFPIVFGPGVGGNMERLRGLLDTDFPLPFHGLDNRRSLISSHSLIDAVTTIIEQNTSPAGVYLVHDGALSTSELVQTIKQGLERQDRQFKLPGIFWTTTGKIPVIGDKILRFTHPLELDDRHFRQTFDWHPPRPLAQELRNWVKNKEPAPP